MNPLRNKFLVAAFVTVGSLAQAQDYYATDYYEPGYAYEFSPGTGDAALDALLLVLNTLYRDDRNAYVDDIVYSTGAPRRYVENLIVQQHYPPADVYLMAQTASLTGRPISYVQREFDTSRGQGWGVVARRLGIQPGSAEFHRLKSGAGDWSTRANGKMKRSKSKTKVKLTNENQTTDRRIQAPARNATVQSHSTGKPEVNGHSKQNGKGQDKEKGKHKSK